MKDGKIYLSREEQIFLMEMLEVDDPNDAVEDFAALLVMERVDPAELGKYLKKIMKKIK